MLRTIMMMTSDRVSVTFVRQNNITDTPCIPSPLSTDPSYNRDHCMAFRRRQKIGNRPADDSYTRSGIGIGLCIHGIRKKVKVCANWPCFAETAVYVRNVACVRNNNEKKNWEETEQKARKYKI